MYINIYIYKYHTFHTSLQLTASQDQMVNAAIAAATAVPSHSAEANDVEKPAWPNEGEEGEEEMDEMGEGDDEEYEEIPEVLDGMCSGEPPPPWPFN